MSMCIVYVIVNPLGKIYIGQTSDLDKRLLRHNGALAHKQSSYTYKHSGTWRLVYTEQFETRVEALRREKQLKSYRDRVFLKEKLSLDG